MSTSTYYFPRSPPPLPLLTLSPIQSLTSSVLLPASTPYSVPYWLGISLLTSNLSSLSTSPSQSNPWVPNRKRKLSRSSSDSADALASAIGEVIRATKGNARRKVVEGRDAIVKERCRDWRERIDEV